MGAELWYPVVTGSRLDVRVEPLKFHIRLLSTTFYYFLLEFSRLFHDFFTVTDPSLGPLLG